MANILLLYLEGGIDAFNKLGSAISLIELASEDINFAITKSNIFLLIINIIIYKQFSIFPKMILFFLPKKSTTIFAGICKNIPNNDFIDDKSTTLAALIFLTCV